LNVAIVWLSLLLHIRAVPGLDLGRDIGCSDSGSSWFSLVRLSKYWVNILNKVITLMMEAGTSSETSVNYYQSTRRNNPEDSHFHTRRRENFESHIMSSFRCYEGVTKQERLDIAFLYYPTLGMLLPWNIPS
jgi:hypothetical protein